MVNEETGDEAEETAPRSPNAVTADRRPALAAGRAATVAAADGPGQTTRRAVLKHSFLGGATVMALGGLGALAKFIWPLNVKGFGGRFTVTADRLPKKGEDPVKIVEAKAWIANLEPDEGTAGIATGGAPGGLLAMYQKCVHLGCTVPWLPDFDFQGEKGWFRCPCHQSTYTKAGIRVFGPAPRHLDTFEISIDSAGRLTINTGKITLGAEDNPSRAIPFNG